MPLARIDLIKGKPAEASLVKSSELSQGII